MDCADGIGQRRITEMEDRRTTDSIEKRELRRMDDIPTRRTLGVNG